MKKSLLYLGISSALLLSTAVQAQTIVSTTAENKNVVLEEMTGIYCYYCPDGHIRAQALKDANPNDVVLVNVHVGGYADPGSSGDPDFRTAFGTALASQSGLCGYPAGTVNRHEFAGLAQTNADPPCTASTAISRGDWTNAAGQSLAESSPVNVAATCTLDVSTNVMTFFVEAYYTGNSNTGTNKLTIAVSENGIKGPQTGASDLNPGNVDSDGNYTHNHVLRAFATGQWGADVTPTTTGTLYSNTFTYTVPTNYNGLTPNLANFEVAVYIAEGQEEILTGVMVPIVYENILTNNAAVASVKDIADVCVPSISPVVTVQNLGSTNLTTLDITYDVNGGASSSYSWTGNLGWYESEEVALPAISFTAQGTNTVNVTFSNPNGSTDDDTSNDSDIGTFSDAPIATTVVELSLLLDQFCSETTWEIQNSSGAVQASGGPYTCDVSGGGADANTTISETFNLPVNDCYSFVIYDTYGDGLNASQWQNGGADGTFTLTSDGNTIATGGGADNFSEDSSPFEVQGGTNGITSIDAVSGVTVFPNPFSSQTTVEFTLLSKEDVLIEVTNIVGELIYSENRGTVNDGTHKVEISGDDLASGVYFVRIQVGDGSITKKIVHN